jgi:tetratricopeptide (TPR) repeat protein
MYKILVFTLSLTLLSCSSNQDDKAIIKMNEGSEFLSSKNYSSALISFKDVLKYSISDELKAKNYRNIAVTFLYLDELDSAQTYSKSGFEAAKLNSYFYFINKAEYHLLSKEIPQAIILYDKASNLNVSENEKMEVYNNLSLIYAGNYGEKYIDLPRSLENANNAFRINPLPVNQEQLASVYFQMENFSKASSLFKSLFESFPEVKMYQFNYGQSLFFLGKEDQGIDLMQKAAERDEKCKILFNQLVQ